MRNSLITFLALVLLAIGCEKPSAGGKPVLKLESVNSDVIPRNSVLRFTFSFESGQKADSVLIMKMVPRCEASSFNASYRVPDYPANSNASLEMFVANGQVEGYADFLSPLCGENDTITFKFVLKDIKGNTSDTAISEKIVFLK